MPEFRYRAVKQSGETVAGVLNMDSRESVRLSIKNEGMIPVEISDSHPTDNLLNSSLFKSRNKKLNLRELSHFCRQLSVIISSGVNTLTGFEALAKQNRDKVMRAEITRIFQSVQTGRTISDAMQEKGSRFPELLAGMVATGEATGTLDVILKNMAAFYAKEYYYRQKIKSAAVYPIIISIMAVAMVIFFISFVLPKMIDIITASGGQLPMLTRVIIGISDIVKNHYILLLIVGISAYTGIKLLLRTEKGKYYKDLVFSKIPVVGNTLRSFVTMRFARTLFLFVSSGYPMIQGLEFIKKNVNNSLAEKAINSAIDGLKRGEGMAENLDKSNYFDKVMIQMTAVGEQTGDLQEIIQEMAGFYEQEAETSLARLVDLTEPVLLITIGAIAGVLIVSVALPMLTVFNNI